MAQRVFVLALSSVVGLIVGLGMACGRCADGRFLGGDEERSAALSAFDFLAARIVRHLQD